MSNTLSAKEESNLLRLSYIKEIDGLHYENGRLEKLLSDSVQVNGSLQSYIDRMCCKPCTSYKLTMHKVWFPVIGWSAVVVVVLAGLIGLSGALS